MTGGGMRPALALLVLAVVGATVAAPCGPDHPGACRFEEGVLNVHIVPHTHDDVGWLKTVDQYYYGSKNWIQKAGVQYILDSVVKELWDDPGRRFIYVETAFFWKWWVRQTAATQGKVRQLVREGRLEFIGGAWSMNDEAAVHYQSTVDQFTWGLRKLNDTFGACARPRVGWQIDPFGHSRELAALLAGMGYEGLFHGRIDYQDKRRRLQDKAMEMLWRGNDDLGAPTDLFTGILYNTYSPPPGFCFDVLCDDEPIIDDHASPMYNVDERVSQLLEYALNQSAAYRSNNVALTMGGDFTYMAADQWYTNLDLLIKYTNLKAAKDKINVKLFYSTPSCYLKAVHAAKPVLPTKQDDFFPYASDGHAYWTGYFTSRPTSKYFERRGNTYLQMVKQMQVLAQLEDHNSFLLDELKSAMGMMQHHDAVTGTEKQHVANDYARILDQAIEDALTVARQALRKWTEGDPNEPGVLAFARCQLNVSECAVTELSDQFVLTVYNPLAWSVSHPVRVPVSGGRYMLYDPEGKAIETQSVEVSLPVISIPTRHSTAVDELSFIAKDLPALGYRSYYVKRQAAQESGRRKREAPGNHKEANHFPLDLPEEYLKPTLNWKDMQEQRVIQEMIKYFVRNNTVDKMTREQDTAPKVPEYVIYQDYGWGQTDKDTDKIDSSEDTGPKMTRDFDEMLKENKNALEQFRRKYLVEKYADDRTSEKEDRKEARGKDLPFKFVHMSSVNEERMLGDDPMVVMTYSDDDFIENEHVRLSLDKTTGKLTNLMLADGTNISFDIELLYYPGSVGDNKVATNRASGAYIFRPNATKPTSLGVNATKLFKGPIVQEIHQIYSDYASSIVRLYKDSPVVEVDWVVGPIPIGDKLGKEVIVRYNTNLSNGDVFFTDSNGRQTLKRILNKRPQWNVSLAEPVAGNYYPVTSKIFIEDLSQKVRLSVLNDRAQGGSSLNEGQIELMLHRRLLNDDAFGVGEALNETAAGRGLVARGTHYIVAGKFSEKLKQFEKRKALEVLLNPQILVSNATNLSFDDWRWLKNEWSGLKDKLPVAVHLLTLEPWKDGTVLLRLEHVLEKADLGSGADGTVSVNLDGLFASFRITKLKETALAANLWTKDKKPLRWETEGEFAGNFNEAYGGDAVTGGSGNVTRRDELDGLVVELKPMEIRTFVVEYEKL